MSDSYIKILENDLIEVKSRKTIFSIKIKLLFYFFQRPLAHFFLKRRLKKDLKNNYFYRKANTFLLNEGGMFKEYAYALCNNIQVIENSTVLIPGCGYGHNLFQLAAWKPKKIVAFDLFEYQQEWDYVKKNALDIFGVQIEFYNGDFSKVPDNYINSFDFIISDAVLEHVKDLSQFLFSSNKFLKEKGVFYASFGPLWYGPGGDHIDWGNGKEFNHLIVPEELYNIELSKKNISMINNSCDGFYMVKEKLFSYLCIEEYFKFFKENNFTVLQSFAKISTRAISYIKKNKRILDSNNVPLFDRYCSGIYVWMRNNKNK